MPARQCSLAGPVPQPYVKVDFIPQSQTKNLASEFILRLGDLREPVPAPQIPLPFTPNGLLKVLPIVQERQFLHDFFSLTTA